MALGKPAKPKAAATDQGAGGVDQIPPDEKSAVQALLAEISRAKTLTKKYREELLPLWRRYTWGVKHEEMGSTSGSQTRTNMIFATQATLLPYIYAKNPEISVAPNEAVGDGEYDLIKGFCQTAQVMLNKVFVEETALKQRAKSNIRSTMTTAVGWLKMSFQQSLSGDPIILRRANDLQDNIQRIEYLAAKAAKETDIPSLERQREELRNQYQALQQSNEVKVYKGLVLDRVQSEDMLILDESVVDFDDYVHAKKLAMGIWLTDEQYEQTFKKKPYAGTSEFGQPASTSEDDESRPQFGEADAKIKYRRVWEVWDHTANTVYTVCEGAAGYCRPPYVPQPTSERWFSFYCLAFNPVEGRWRPLSDVELLRRLQDEYNTTRFLFAEARKEAIATWVFRKSGNLTEEDIKKLSERRPRQFIGIEGNPTVPLDQDIKQFEGIKIDAEAYDVTIIRNDMDMLVGLSDASRANLIEAKTATEADIMRQALLTRAAERQDSHEDLLSQMAKDALEVMLQRFTKEEVAELVGEEAVWPELSTEDIFRKVNVSVRAGSTGRPNQQKERESWQAIMPVLKESIQQVAELRAAGQFDMADSVIELVKETLKRFDERIDIDRFIPRPELGEDGMPVQQQNAIAQAQQLVEENAALKEELTKVTQEHEQMKLGEASKTADAEAKRAISVAQEAAKQAEAEARVAEAAAKEQAKVDEAVRLAEIKKAEAIEIAKINAASRENIERDRIEAQKEIARITARGKILSAKPKPTNGEGEAAPAEGEGAVDDEYAAMAQVLQNQTAALTNLAQAVEAFAKAQGAPRELTVTTPEGRELKGRSSPTRLNG